MSVQLAGSTSADRLEFANIASAAMNDAYTLFMLFRIMTASDNTWQSFMEFDRSGGGNACGFLRAPTGGSIGEIGVLNTNVLVKANVLVSDADNWMGIWVTRAADTTTNIHKFPIGGSRTTSLGNTVADGLAWNSVLKIGGDEDPANIRVKAAAFWNGVTLTTTQIDAVHSAATSAAVAALSPTWLADDSDGFATNLVNPGTGDRTVNGGTSNGDNPAGWVSGLTPPGTTYTKTGLGIVGP